MRIYGRIFVRNEGGLMKKKTGRKEQKPNFIIKFDGKKYSENERDYLISRFIQVLSRIESRTKGEKQPC